MSRSNGKISRVAVAAVVALWAGSALASAPAHEASEATLPEAAYRITNWGFDGHRGMWIEAGNQNYYGEFLSPCVGAVPDHVLFRFNPDGSLNRFSKVYVPRDRQVCAFKTFRASVVSQAKEPAQEVR